MIKVTEEKIIDKLNSLSEETREMLLMLSYNDDFISMVNHDKVKSKDIIDDIERYTRMTALGFMSKEELFLRIEETVGDENEARYIFKEIDTKILVPNGFKGLIEEAGVASKESDEDILESAEEILREIENPTPAKSSLQSLVPEIKPTQELEIIKTETVHSNPIPTNTNTAVSETTPTESIATETKTTQLDSKLKETVTAPVKTTYYKVDPYREQPE